MSNYEKLNLILRKLINLKEHIELLDQIDCEVDPKDIVESIDSMIEDIKER